VIDPRNARKIYLRVLKTQENFEEWLKHYDQAVESGSDIPEEIAWIEFKRRFTPLISGGWERIKGVD